MFSQFAKRLQDGLDAVEHIAASGVSSVTDGAQPSGSVGDAKQTASSHRQPYSSENARNASSPSLSGNTFSSLRRSATSQRPASPSDVNQARVTPQSNKGGRELDPVRRVSTLEERLRASLATKSGARAGSPVFASPKSGEAQDNASANQETDALKIPLPPSPPPEPGVSTPPVSSKPLFTDPPSPGLIVPELRAPHPKPHSQVHSVLSSSSSVENLEGPPSIPQFRTSIEQEGTF